MRRRRKPIPKTRGVEIGTFSDGKVERRKIIEKTSTYRKRTPRTEADRRAVDAAEAKRARRAERDRRVQQ